MKSAAGTRRWSLSPSIWIFAGVFALRLLALAQLAASPSLLPAGGDMQFYDAWAGRIARGELTDHQAFYGLPLYPYLLALFYTVFGHNPFVPGVFQAALDAATACFIYNIGVLAFAPRSNAATANSAPLTRAKDWQARFIGIVSAVVWAFFVPAQAYSIILMPTAAATAVFWFVVWRIIKGEAPLTRRACLGFGLLIGVMATGVATVLLAVPLLIAAIFRRIANVHLAISLRSGAFSVILLLTGVSLGSAPCWLHNVFVARDPVFLSAHSGINFWIGNNAEATGYPHFPAPLRASQAAMLEDSIAIAESAAGRPLRRSEVAQYWSGKARSYISSHPAAWVKLIGRKIGNFWSAFEDDDVSVIGRLSEEGVIMPGPHFGLIAALALPGMVLAAVAFPASRWIAAAVLLQLLSVLPVFVTERYRLPAVPGLILFASAGLWFLWRSCLERRVARVAAYLLIAACSAAWVASPPRDLSLWALRLFDSGNRALERGDLRAAHADLERAYAYVPDNAELNLALGNLRQAEGDAVSARSFYGRTLRLVPEHESALNNLGALELAAGNWDLAEHFFRSASRLNPANAKLHYLIAKAAAGRGDFATAAAENALALQLAPSQLEFRAFADELASRNR